MDRLYRTSGNFQIPGMKGIYFVYKSIFEILQCYANKYVAIDKHALQCTIPQTSQIKMEKMHSRSHIYTNYTTMEIRQI